MLHADSNPFHATIGLRVEPAPAGAGIELRARRRFQDRAAVRLQDARELHGRTCAEYVRHALREGLAGWRVTDCVVTMTTCGYSIPDGPPSRRGPRSTAADFRKLTPLVVKRALEHAGTVVCEPLVRAELELPA